MIGVLNNMARRLWKDESGVVLAVTMIVFLALFLMALAVYAVGDTVRLRVEVQNAADAAAYSGAIVQADCNSRVAAINRAMSWTWVQLCRMEMDYIVDKWLEKVMDTWEDDDSNMKQFNQSGSCQNWGLPFYSVGKNKMHTMIRLNRSQTVSYYQIKAAREGAKAQGKDYDSLEQPIKDAKDTINDMNDREKSLIEALPGHVEKTVKKVLEGNISETWNDSFAGGGGIMYQLRQEEAPLDSNFRILKSEEESDFLRHADYNQGVQQTFETGIDVWYKPEPGLGFKREYEQQGNVLLAEWDYESTMYQQVEEACVEMLTTSGSSTVKGEDVKDEQFVTTRAKPRVLQELFFARGGAIRVGVTRKVNNPFQFMVECGELGIVRPFTLDHGSRYMWTVTAAIAGYNPKPRHDCQGKYEVTYEDNSGDNLWNLKTSDWDAELIPLHRARAIGKSRSWTGATAGEILGEMKGGPWKPLYGGGGAPGSQGGPKGMNEGAEIAYGGAEGWVVH